MKGKRSVIYLIIYLLFFFSIYGKSHSKGESNAFVIRGIIQDIHQHPLEGVRVSLKNLDPICFSNGRGEFVLKLAGQFNNLTLVFEHKKFHPYRLRISRDRALKPLSVMLVPKEYLQEEISVTAMNREERSVDVPAAESVVSELEIKEKIPENIVSTMLNTPGMHFIGSGGFSITPSIRGIARRRVLILVDGMRVSGDRRAGVSATFLSPEVVEKIEVVRSASSVLYGSDAIGGVIQLITQSPGFDPTRRNILNLSAGLQGQRLNAGLLTRQNPFNLNLTAGFQLTRADNYSTPVTEIYHSGYTSYSGLITLQKDNGKREFTLSYIGGIGSNLGKPNRDNDPRAYTRVSEEGEHFIRLHYREKKLPGNGRLDLLFYVNPSLYALEKFKPDDLAHERTRNSGTNLGLKATLKKSLSQSFSLQSGLEWFGRRGFDFENSLEDPHGQESTYPLREGRRDDTSLFLTADYSGIPGVDIMGGIRYTWFGLQALVEGEKKIKNSEAPSFFVGATKKFGKSVSLFFNLGRAFRLPGLSESFYTGLTGRKYVVGNPDLIPESSLNLDTGIKVFLKKFFLGVYLFSYRIDDLIERYKNEEDIYTYDNITMGNIRGVEVEFQYFPVDNLEVFGHYFYYHGRDTEQDEPLNDIPSPKLLIGCKLLKDRFWAEINYLHSYEKSDPGPAEIENSAYRVVSLKTGYYFSTRFNLNLKVSNFFNALYYPNADPDIPPARGIDISLGIHYYF